MSFAVYRSAVYTADEDKQGGLTVRNAASGDQRYFQPGDDARSVITTLAALEEIWAENAAVLSDHYLSQYFGSGE